MHYIVISLNHIRDPIIHYHLLYNLWKMISFSHTSIYLYFISNISTQRQPSQQGTVDRIASSFSRTITSGKHCVCQENKLHLRNNQNHPLTHFFICLTIIFYSRMQFYFEDSILCSEYSNLSEWEDVTTDYTIVFIFRCRRMISVGNCSADVM